ncbi:MAG: aminotransferase class V-fold PLP-dependent enzyme [Planctomycetaceae bacterium]|nr:aminotransferase class V-fold PLP-dependent enzyme [Planctomycetaceae bacterium]
MAEPALHPLNWNQHRSAWSLADGVTYLNHGSFGPAPDVVIAARQRWFAELERQPMDFLARRLEPLLDEAAAVLAKFVGCGDDDLVFVPNATTGINIVARSVELAAGDEVLLTDHEYGAVARIWGNVCSKVGARTTLAKLPLPLLNPADVVDAVFARVNERTKVIVVSHIASYTAVVLPIADICRRANERGILTCIDGPHGLVQAPLNLRELGCDYYAASCHKWLCGPIGSGFLYVRGRHKSKMRPAVMSWGQSFSGRPSSWKDEFVWVGTDDPSSYLAVADAVRFIESVGVQEFRRRTHMLAREARNRCAAIARSEPFTPDDPAWYGSMVTIPLPHVARSSAWPGEPHPLQRALWEQHRIETPVCEWQDRLCLRVSCHLYNTPADIDRLCAALEALCPRFAT